MHPSPLYAAFAALWLFSTTTQAGCINVGGGHGNNPLKCKSYSVPKQIGQSVTVEHTLTLRRTDGDQSSYYTEWVWYDLKNEQSYKVNFAVQFWNPQTNQNGWKSYTLDPGEKCNVNFYSTLQNVKLTC
ncbi:hypothetical protein QIS74_03493 [Colletotrichum tabaci]|uniref:Uncharacterized protein n=1 Tax=Colletotrichum tabaci TaxID=1209068 RepID=A0AAV9TNU9_9PEZI